MRSSAARAVAIGAVAASTLAAAAAATDIAAAAPSTTLVVSEVYGGGGNSGAEFTHFGYQVVHVNAEYSDQISDHDPQVVDFTP